MKVTRYDAATRLGSLCDKSVSAASAELWVNPIIATTLTLIARLCPPIPIYEGDTIRRGDAPWLASRRIRLRRRPTKELRSP